MPSNEEMLEAAFYFDAVGRGISAWATMEGTLVIVGALLLGISSEKSGIIFYSIINFNAWLSIITELFSTDEAFADAKARWEKIARDLRRLNNTRVRLAHHPYDIKTKGLLPGPLDKTKKSANFETLTLDDLNYFKNEVREAAHKIRALAKELYDLTP